MSTAQEATGAQRPVEKVETVTIRFVGDSGDGMQLTGTEFTKASALAGNDLATFPDYPAEIRAPAGSLFGVSGFQINFASKDVHMPGDQPDVLVAMNPAALKTNLPDLRLGGMLVTNTGAFSGSNLEKAGFKSNPLDDASLKQNYKLLAIDMDKMTQTAVAGMGLGSKDAARCKNYFALGLMYWLYSRPMEPQLENIQKKFAKKPEIAKANVAVFKAGYAYGETAEVGIQRYQVPAAKLPAGTYRNVTGNFATALGFAAVAKTTGRQVFLGSYPITPATEILQECSYFKEHGVVTFQAEDEIAGNFATALGFAAVAKTTGRQVFLGSYPITPATEILQEMSYFKEHGVVTFQAEDEIAGIGSAIGASFGGALACTTTSGPGLALKTEMMGLAIIMELPLVIVNVQRGGPSTGMPTKTEQADLYMALFGRHGEAPLPVIAAQSPADCFYGAMEAMKIAVKWMTPVILLTDGYLGNGSEPFRVPDESELPKVEPKYQTTANGPDGEYLPYKRDEKLIRPWAVPGTPGLEHRVGGLEKDSLTGMVSYDGSNHERMVKTRAQKIANVIEDVPDLRVDGPAQGDVLLLSWGGTYGSVRTVTEKLHAQGKSVAHAHLRWLNPMPKNLGALLKSYKKVVVPEVNDGQLANVIRMRYPGVDPIQFNRINGKPIKVAELAAFVLEQL